MVIPKSSKATPPFPSKQKDLAPRKQPLLKTPHERNVHTLVQDLQLLNIEKEAQPSASEPMDLTPCKRPLLEDWRGVVMESPGRTLYKFVQHLRLIQAEEFSVACHKRSPITSPTTHCLLVSFNKQNILARVI
ncbi:hypothetical protein SASPL_150927 [Salvia splendens]|uniref:Uncharacterized protein n=1 Tax=Salvia splendens TaxID=180675 RepID=A0A8X8Z343_SALSN|nr:hypothetical protein SASPL_150927 [Salvia splendens]